MNTENAFAYIYCVIFYYVCPMVDSAIKNDLYIANHLPHKNIAPIEQQTTSFLRNPVKTFDAACNYHKKILSKKQINIPLSPEDKGRNKRFSALCGLIAKDVKFESGDKHELQKVNHIDNYAHINIKTQSKGMSTKDIMNSSIKSHTSFRTKRSAANFVHKLIRISPGGNFTKKSYSKENFTSDVRLNTSSFAVPHHGQEFIEQKAESSTLSYEQLEDLAFADLNGTEIELLENVDNEQLPNPEELVSGPRYRVYSKHRSNLQKSNIKRKRIPIRSYQLSEIKNKCERFTASMCIKADDYPMEQIMGSIRRHKNAMSALLADYNDKTAELEYQEQLEDFHLNNKRREDVNVITPGGMCASMVRYARPQKARSASGEWKYIVNTGRHTQTLRLEKCSTPQESCSYLSHNYRSRCTQVYNYHRLLSWDKSRGLHVDIFKVPTCCSCQVDGYRETFPPLGVSKLQDYKDLNSVQKSSPYITVNDEIDYEDEEDGDITSFPHRFGSRVNKNNHENYKNFEVLLGSTNVKTKFSSPRHSPTVRPFLSPPSDSYETKTVLKSTRPTFGGRSRKPYKSYVPNEPRVDLEISGTEHSDKEVRPQQKRNRIYSESSNFATPYQTIDPNISSESNLTYITPQDHTTHSNTQEVSSIRSSRTRIEVGNSKRINYNYHPIIDFFENHKTVSKGQSLARNSATNNIPLSSEIITSGDKSIPYIIGGVENKWHPLAVNSLGKQ